MKISRLFKEFRALANRNRYILKEKNKNRKIKKNQVNLHWWQSPDGVPNLGDNLSPFIVEQVLKRQEKDLDFKTGKTRHLYAIGSIISIGYQDATIWGSGLKGKNIRSRKFWKYFRKLDIRVVRGPRTREQLLDIGYNCPETYGDPAVLLPLFIKPAQKEKKYDFVTIKHHSDNRTFNIDDNISYLELDIKTDDFQTFVDTICQAKTVISSSLHGIILAESYGIPTIMLHSDTISDHFKFHDWYESTGRQNFPIAFSVEEAITMTPLELPNLDDMRDRLLASFPYDLFV